MPDVTHQTTIDVGFDVRRGDAALSSLERRVNALADKMGNIGGGRGGGGATSPTGHTERAVAPDGPAPGSGVIPTGSRPPTPAVQPGGATAPATTSRMRGITVGGDGGGASDEYGAAMLGASLAAFTGRPMGLFSTGVGGLKARGAQFQRGLAAARRTGGAAGAADYAAAAGLARFAGPAGIAAAVIGGGMIMGGNKQVAIQRRYAGIEGQLYSAAVGGALSPYGTPYGLMERGAQYGFKGEESAAMARRYAAGSRVLMGDTPDYIPWERHGVGANTIAQYHQLSAEGVNARGGSFSRVASMAFNEGFGPSAGAFLQQIAANTTALANQGMQIDLGDTEQLFGRLLANTTVGTAAPAVINRLQQVPANLRQRMMQPWAPLGDMRVLGGALERSQGGGYDGFIEALEATTATQALEDMGTGPGGDYAIAAVTGRRLSEARQMRTMGFRTPSERFAGMGNESLLARLRADAFADLFRFTPAGGMGSADEFSDLVRYGVGVESWLTRLGRSAADVAGILDSLGAALKSVGL